MVFITKFMRQSGSRTFLLTAAVSIGTGLVVCFELGRYWGWGSPQITAPRYLLSLRSLPTGASPSLLDFTFQNGEGTPEQLTDQDLPLLKGSILKTSLGKVSD